jgi:hypothetical protein
VNSANLADILPKIAALSEKVRTDIENSVNAGYTVTVPETNVTYGAWKGAAYIVMDIDSGTSLFMLEKGINGGEAIVDFLPPAYLLPNSNPSILNSSILPCLGIKCTYTNLLIGIKAD